jgi:hypothetical protein
MINAKDEILNHISNKPKIKCVSIQFTKFQYELVPHYINLETAWDGDEWEIFIDRLSFEYNNGYGSQNLTGTIWYIDGTWSRRCEYDGSEWWEYISCPEIPDFLIRRDKEREEKLNQIL